MAGIPKLPQWPDTPEIREGREVVRRLQEAGHEACFVGGCVRDWLFGLEPHDVDIATSARPEQIAALFERTRAVGAHFGVVLVMTGAGPVEVATFRADGEYLDFRRPSEVTFGTLEEDALRRDFTVNAMFWDPVAERLIDHTGGALDVRRRVLRSVGHARKRFEEDALRLMRGVRLAVRFELEIEANTRKGMIARAANLEKISRERVGEELLRILTGPHPDRAVRMLDELGLWPFIMPEITALHGVEQGKRYHPEGDVFEHTVRVVGQLPPDPDPALALSALLHDIGKPATREVTDGKIGFPRHQRVGAEMAAEICRRLRYGNELTANVADLVDHHMQFIEVRKMRESGLKRLLGRPNFPLLLDLHRADILGSSGDLSAWEYCVEQRRLLAEQHGDEMRPPKLATGDDLIELGLRPGPAFARMLEALHDEQLEGRVGTREEALAFLRERAREENEAADGSP